MDVEETMKRINSHKGVLGIIIVNNDGIPIRTTLDAQVTVQYAALVTHLASKARSVVRKLDEQNDLHFLRIRRPTLLHRLEVKTILPPNCRIVYLCG